MIKYHIVLANMQRVGLKELVKELNNSCKSRSYGTSQSSRKYYEWKVEDLEHNIRNYCFESYGDFDLCNSCFINLSELKEEREKDKETKKKYVDKQDELLQKMDELISKFSNTEIAIKQILTKINDMEERIETMELKLYK